MSENAMAWLAILISVLTIAQQVAFSYWLRRWPFHNRE